MSHDPFSPASAVPPPVDDAEPLDSAVGSVGLEAPVAPQAAPQGTDGGNASSGPEVPRGTAKEVHDWVGGDKDRARAALEVERASAEPRKGLTRELEELVGDNS